MEFGESKSRQVWETPSRSTLVKPKSAGLSRGPSLTFKDQGPKIIARKPPSSRLDNSPPRIFQPKNSEWPKKIQEKEPNSAPAWQTTFAPAYAASNNPSGNSGFASNNPTGNFPRRDVNDFRDQSQLEADYFDERKIRESQEFEKYSEIYQPEDFDFEDFLEDEIELQIPNVPHTMLTPDFAPDPTDRMDLSELDATVFSGSKRPKKSYGSSFSDSDSGSGSFDQVFQLNGTPKPSQKSDKFGYAEIVHHTGPQDDYLAPSASSHDHKSSGGNVETRKPGPYGYPSPNFKCEYAKETLYVTKTDWSFDKKCFTVFRTKCRQEYDSGKGIGFQKECSEFTVTRCRTEYDTDSETKCWTVFRKECSQVYVSKVDWEYEEKCETKHEEVCKGYGYDKHCEQVPSEHCLQIPIKVEKQVPRTKCKKVPEKKCQDFPIFIPRKACKDFPKTVCVKDPMNVPRKIPKKVCASIPKEVCNKIPVQIIKHVPKTVTKKVCTSTKPSGYTPYSDEASYYPPPSYSDGGGYHTSRSEQSRSNSNPNIGALNGQGNDARFVNQDDSRYYDGVEDVPHFNYNQK